MEFNPDSYNDRLLAKKLSRDADDEIIQDRYELYRENLEFYNEIPESFENWYYQYKQEMEER